ncbi:proton-coupled folate transporter-like [Leptidea sinapis]|uniref:proton-coupled folate transporter-like n=1 Tax=Leptidea sinapis TaxID=189913 RepID=UPI0021291F72|nr:proton-coupled folate transporter-like [Leptidea sinapis]XP_050678679.1 proton-coupled folate transporter-like [Leptidea sinapis]XP_050678756.1 proton-coupled folate transporter-like [Leptidea sinapis]XP_050678824.1 proton-coupled folate transporter-like [Leptidea sinapis]
MAEEKQETSENIEENPLNSSEVIKYKDRNFTNKLCYIREHITVEPLLAGFIIPSVISRFAMGNFNLDKACRVNLGFGDEICEALVKKTSSNYSSYEKEVQTLISSIDIWKGMISTLLPCIIIMFLGAWSDRTGKRKLCILLPIFGEFATSINNIVNVFFFYEIPVQVTIFLEVFFTAVSGGWVTMFLGVFSYISDITSERSRTFRVGLVNFCMTAGVPLGVGVGGVLVQKMGYYGLFTSTSVMFAMVLMYGCFLLKEPEDFLRDKGRPTVERTNSKDVAFFDANHIVDTIGVALRRRVSNTRTKVILTLVAVFLIYGPSMSEHNILYLFVRNQLNWNMMNYSIFLSYSIILHSIGAMFSITILSKKLQVDDSLLCLIAMTSKFVGAMWTAFVKTNLEMYLIPVAEFFTAATLTSLRSILSKLVEKDEIAKVNSLFSLTETLAALLFNPLYSWLYMKTLSSLPGAVFLTSAGVIIPAAIILLSFFIQHRIAVRNARKNAFEAEEKKEAESNKLPDKRYLPETIQPSQLKEKTKL